MQKKIGLLICCVLLVASLSGAPPSISLVSPQGGEAWLLGSTHAIAWTTVPGVSGTLYIGLWGYNKGGQLIHLGQIAEANYKLGSYSWKVGEYAGQRAGVGKYHIRVNIWVNSTTNIQAINKVPFYIVAFLHR